MPALMAVLLVGAAGAAYKYGIASDDSNDSDAPDTPGAASAPLLVQTEAFSFSLPATPTIEPLANVVSGLPTTGTQWTVESGDFHLVVSAINFGFALDAPTQQGAFDGAIADRALQVGGSILSDTWVVSDLGVYARDTIMSVSGGLLHMRSYGKGAWGVFFSGPSSGSERPAGFTDTIVSFVFV